VSAPALPRLAITAGEPAGIGAELLLALAASDIAADLIAIVDPTLLAQTAAALGRSVQVNNDDGARISQRPANSLRCVPVALRASAQAGVLDARNAAYVIQTLTVAADGCSDGTFDALVTAPVHKAIINDAGIAFSGHTEFFAERAHAQVLMLLATPSLRVALATTHLPLAAVPAAITRARLTSALQILHSELRSKFQIDAPRISVLGLNPHAGEGGHMGREEIDTIAPVIQALRAQGMNLLGPLPADTAFVPAVLTQVDAVLAMYHDQGLPVLKAQGFGEAVNITLGLPYVRTSVDHGTALDLAGSGRADASSLLAATRMALELLVNGRNAHSIDVDRAV
jgi:4-hydroxythreonine-4-phosphate dehydrogenase